MNVAKAFNRGLLIGVAILAGSALSTTLLISLAESAPHLESYTELVTAGSERAKADTSRLFAQGYIRENSQDDFAFVTGQAGGYLAADFKALEPVLVRNHFSTLKPDLIQERDAAQAPAEIEEFPLAVNTTIFMPILAGNTEIDPGSSIPWLNYVNLYRAAMNLVLLEVNEAWSYGGQLHSRYMVKNDYVTHYEDPSNAWYTPEGYDAGRSSNVFVSSWLATSDEDAIDFWMAAPFHAISIIDPQLLTTGFGSYREDDAGWRMGATLDVIRGRGQLPADTEFPLLFPPAGGQTWLLRYPGYEFPDPLTSCPGYAAPTGPPIMVQLGAGELIPHVYSFTIESEGQVLESCMFDETNYVNPNSGMQYSGRIVLNNRDAVVLMPREPLISGREYKATLATDLGVIEWTFHAISLPGLHQRELPGAFEIR